MTARVSLITGTQTIGQGHETTFPQILADRLGVPNALHPAAPGRYRPDPDRRRPWQLARHLYGRHGDLARVGHDHRQGQPRRGRACWKPPTPISSSPTAISRSCGTNRSIALLEVAARARELGTPLDTYHAWTREHMTFPNGTHVVEVEVDRDTGRVSLVRLTAVDDYGVLVNPMVAAGQAHGAIAQGAGQALLEHAVYDPASGQLLAGIVHGLRDAARRRFLPLPTWASTRRAAPPIRWA